ncbi:glycosyltransferase family 2 protein [Sphingobacterium sp. ML3W]|uniref:glycosyltransferase family 2 protein n=1 Tax=Sphingobacterium sp. ML3W TaxID=1538644 RepID=UPI00249AAD10|nr:glycosyltransferase family 2 protein [Sphingobacterium sp. ML3W]WFA78210.1 glycosyltransferase family 2 protein [Sphingobacterium sp. ML3W]
MNQIKVSVVIPMYNAAKSILQTVNSVYAQTWQEHIEIIIINDGSTDDSQILVENYIKDQQRDNIRLVNQKNAGVSVARNEGMKRCTGDWICLLDSDDTWLPNKLERQLQILEADPTIDFLGTTRNGEYIQQLALRKLDVINQISAKELLFKFVFVTPTIIFKREIVDRVGYFDETQRYAEEGNYFIRIANKCKSYLLNESLVITGGGKHDFGESGLSSNLWEMEKGELKNIRMALRIGIINSAEYLFFNVFSLLKYARRVLIVFLR